ncbi:oxygenase MpaB family protein [Nocardioides sp.]|uniref:oxygenase MpaB family protein n=1 Tax=Nocardioides sp. TaxID=35761 RepID=UPI003D0DD3CA
MPLGVVRRSLAQALRARIAGDDAASRAQKIWQAEGERWFTPDDPIWWVHMDASMFAGGIRALLLQSLHPLAMAGVDQHSAYRDDPWTRVQRTSSYIATTTFGTIRHAEQVIGAVRRIHERVQGTTTDGTPYRADDPHLLMWVHVAEVESFLTTYQRFGGRPLSQGQADRYVAQTGVAAERLGVLNPPQSEADLRAVLAGYRPELVSSPEARQAARFLLREPPLPLLARPGYHALAAGAVNTLPTWARRELGVVRRPAGATTGVVATTAVRWLMSDPSVSDRPGLVKS